MKKVLIRNVALAVTSTMILSSCGGGETTTESTEASETVEPIELDFWYGHTGPEADAYEAAIDAFNESQDEYHVTGLSVTDQQKIIVAMSGGDAPDIIERPNGDVISYANNGLLESMTEYDSNDEDFSLDDTFTNQSLQANTVDGAVYAVPISAMNIQMYYNKDILAEIGYTEPPTTMEELYEMAVAATEVDENGTITRLGYPLFPLASARQELIYAFGGRWWSEDGTTLTPDDPEIIDSLNMNLKYRSLYGIEPVQEFVATANTNRYTENDMFFTGKQLFRFDGPWLSSMMEDYGSTVNYGVALIPGTESNPELQGTSRYETNSLMIPVGASDKEGAWEFIKSFSTADAMKDLLVEISNMPVQKDFYDDPEILGMKDSEIFLEALEKEKGIIAPDFKDLAKYTSLIEEYLDYVYNGMMTPEDAMAELKEQSKDLQ